MLHGALIRLNTISLQGLDIEGDPGEIVARSASAIPPRPAPMSASRERLQAASFSSLRAPPLAHQGASQGPSRGTSAVTLPAQGAAQRTSAATSPVPAQVGDDAVEYLDVSTLAVPGDSPQRKARRANRAAGGSRPQSSRMGFRPPSAFSTTSSLGPPLDDDVSC